MTADRVILLTVDALGAKHVGHYGYERNTTPNLDSYFDRGLSFENCIAQSSHTRESMFSMFLSEYPFEFGGVGRISASDITLATVLSDNDVAVAGFHSNPYLSRAYNFNQGFDTFDDSLPLGRNRIVSTFHRVVNYFKVQPYTRGEDLNAKGISWLNQERSEESEFLWLHYMDPHGPYQPPKRFQRQFIGQRIGERRAKRLWRKTVDSPEDLSEAERKTVRGLYDAEVRYVDECIHDFVETVKEDGSYENTTIIIAADHGELFGEHGSYGHPRQVYHELVHVPLVITGGGIQSDSITIPVENIDIAPTVVDLLGLAPISAFRGDSLVGKKTTQREFAISQASGEGEDTGINRISVTTESYHYTAEYSQSEKIKESIFGIEPDQRPQVNIDSVDESVLAGLSGTAKRFINAPGGKRRTKSESSPGRAVEERLEDLGYK